MADEPNLFNERDDRRWADPLSPDRRALLGGGAAPRRLADALEQEVEEVIAVAMMTEPPKTLAHQALTDARDELERWQRVVRAQKRGQLI